MPRAWKDLARTIPCQEGDLVAVLELDGYAPTLIQVTTSHRPTFRDGRARFDDIDDYMRPAQVNSSFWPPADEADTPHIVTVTQSPAS